MLTSPFLQELESARNVLIAGIGGGFDVFSGLPLYFGLQYRDAMLETRSYMDINDAIDAFRLRCAAIRPLVAIPL